MLMNEYYKVTTSLTNNNDSDLKSVEIIISLPTNLLNKVFLLNEEPTKSSRLSSRIRIDVGAMKASANMTVCFYITSMIEGNIELKQSLCYQTENNSPVDDLSTFNQVSSPTEPSKTIEKLIAEKDDAHDIVVEYLDNNLVRKKRDNILIIPCVEEFHFEGKFYTLDRRPALTCYKSEDLILRCTLKMTSPFSIDIIDAFLIADVNIDELRNQNKKFVSKNTKRGAEIENLVTLRPNCSSTEWVTKETFKKSVNGDASKIFDAKTIEARRKVSNIKDNVPENVDDPFALKCKDQKLNYANTGEVCKTIINNALDVTELIDSECPTKKGFVNAKLNLLDEKTVDPNRKFGLYCIKWKKSDSEVVNESKFSIKGIGKFKHAAVYVCDLFFNPTDVRDPLINVYCSIQERVFVREFFTYKITLRNPHPTVLTMIATFNVSASDGFMFAGHRQVNVTILSNSEFDLLFNLYPLKANFQRLPELKLELFTSQDDPPKESVIETTQKPEVSQNQLELNELLKRWLPKSVFVHVSSRQQFLFSLTDLTLPSTASNKKIVVDV